MKSSIYLCVLWDEALLQLLKMVPLLMAFWGGSNKTCYFFKMVPLMSFPWQMHKVGISLTCERRDNGGLGRFGTKNWLLRHQVWGVRLPLKPPIFHWNFLLKWGPWAVPAAWDPERNAVSGPAQTSWPALDMTLSRFLKCTEVWESWHGPILLPFLMFS